MNARTTQILIGAVAAIALFGGGFALGRTLAPAPAPASDSATNPAGGGTAAQQAARRAALGGGQGALAGAGQATVGRILSVNDGSITVEIRQPAAAGGAGATPALTSTIALLGADTRILRTVEQEIKLADLKAGDQVTIVGTTDAATGTVSANAVLVGGGALQQVFGGQRPGGGGRVPGASPSPTGR
jgi:hypothetical protein